MIKVKGYRYINDNKMPAFEEDYENQGIWMHYLLNDIYSKDRVYLPALNNDGSFNQNYVATQSGCIRYYRNDCDDYRLIELILDDKGKVLFSSGSRTRGKGHISKIISEELTKLDEWRKSDYEYAD